MRGLSEVVGQIGPVGQQDRDAQIFSDSIRSHLTLNSLDWQGLVDRTDRTGKTGKTAWIDLTKILLVLLVLFLSPPYCQVGS